MAKVAAAAWRQGQDGNGGCVRGRDLATPSNSLCLTGVALDAPAAHRDIP